MQIEGKTLIEKQKKKINDKKEILKNIEKDVSKNFLEVINVDFNSLLQIEEKFLEFQKKEAFRIRKVDELEFSNNSRPENWMVHSFYELENIE